MRKRTLWLSLMLLLLTAPAVLAADLHGYIADKAGRPLVAKVELKDGTARPAGQPTMSDAKGHYSFTELKPGSYEIVVNGKALGKIFVGPGETRRDLRVN